jgi:hypothetical protein
MAEAAHPPSSPRPSRGRSAILAALRRSGQRRLALLARLALLVLVVAAADRSHAHLDASPGHRFTIDPQLRRLLVAQTQPVAIVGIWGADLVPALADVDLACRRIGAVSPLVTYQHLDPQRDAAHLALVVSAHHDDDQPGLMVLRGDRLIRIALSDDLPRVLQRALGAALSDLARARLPTVLLLQGHGELHPGGGGADGDDDLLDALALSGFAPRAWEIARDGPPAADQVVALLGPRSPLGDADCRAIEAHLRDGGALLVLADDRQPADLSLLLRRHGVIMTPSPQPPGSAASWLDQLAPRLPPGQSLPPPPLVACLHGHVAESGDIPYHELVIDAGQIAPDHPVTSRSAQAGASVLSPFTCPIAVLQPGLLPPAAGQALAAAFAQLGVPPFSATPLLITRAHDAWLTAREAGFRTPAHLDAAPPAILAWAIAGQRHADSVQDHGARLVIWGSRQAASNAVLDQPGFGNRQLLTDAVAWLAGDQADTGIPAIQERAYQVRASAAGLDAIAAALVALLPSLCIGVAIIAWWERRG